MGTEIDFYRKVGELIKACQCIEHDIKLIYAGMIAGSFDDNWEKLKNKTLGQAVLELQELDNSDGQPYFSKSDYDLLKEITQKRNYWVHQGFIDYVYDRSKFNNQYQRLKIDNDQLVNLMETTEKIRLDYFGYDENGEKYE